MPIPIEDILKDRTLKNGVRIVKFISRDPMPSIAWAVTVKGITYTGQAMWAAKARSEGRLV